MVRKETILELSSSFDRCSLLREVNFSKVNQPISDRVTSLDLNPGSSGSRAPVLYPV